MPPIQRQNTQLTRKENGIWIQFTIRFYRSSTDGNFFSNLVADKKDNFRKNNRTGLAWNIGAFIFFSGVIQRLTAKTELKKKDYYGEYIIDRDCFPGKQADWQYEHFRFEINEHDSIFFFVTNKEKIVRTFRGTVSTTHSNSSQRLIINMKQPTHHILSSNPTVYRSTWSFYLVFYSPKFNNVFFKKGRWKQLRY